MGILLYSILSLESWLDEHLLKWYMAKDELGEFMINIELLVTSNFIPRPSFLGACPK
jgi:hypothetical protein